MRQDALPEADMRAARRALAAWDVAAVGIERVSVSENIVFRVDATGGKRFVLRLHRPGYHTLAELRSEQAWTVALTQAGVDAPIARRTRRGEGYAPVVLGVGAGEWRYAGLLEWVDGTPLWAAIDAALETPRWEAALEHFAALGAIMAAIHNQSSRWRAPRGFVRHRLDADGFVGEQPFWGRFWESPHASAAARRRLAALRHRVAGKLRSLPMSKAEFGLIHADLHAGNVIVDERRLHVIDFDDAGFGWHAYELAAALHSYQAHPRREDFQTALVTGYRRVRPIADAVIASVPLFLLVRTLASIGWTAARPEHNGERTRELVALADAVAPAVLGHGGPPFG